MDVVSIDQPGLVAQWIRRLPTEQEIPGSSPGGVNLFFPHPGGDERPVVLLEDVAEVSRRAVRDEHDGLVAVGPVVGGVELKKRIAI